MTIGITYVSSLHNTKQIVTKQIDF